MAGSGTSGRPPIGTYTEQNFCAYCHRLIYLHLDGSWYHWQPRSAWSDWDWMRNCHKWVLDQLAEPEQEQVRIL